MLAYLPEMKVLRATYAQTSDKNSDKNRDYMIAAFAAGDLRNAISERRSVWFCYRTGGDRCKHIFYLPIMSPDTAPDGVIAIRYNFPLYA